MERKTVFVVVAVLIGLMVVGGVGSELSRHFGFDRPSADEIDRAERRRVDLGKSDTFVLDDEAGDKVLVTRAYGDTTYDLTRAKGDTDVRIELGVGDATVILPQGAGVRVYGRHDGFGRWVTPGMVVDGDHFVNAAYGRADTNIDLQLYRGNGTVRVVPDDLASATR